MLKDKFKAAVAETKTETHDALQLVVDTLNQGQRKKILRNEAVQTLCERFGVRAD